MTLSLYWELSWSQAGRPRTRRLICAAAGGSVGDGGGGDDDGDGAGAVAHGDGGAWRLLRGSLRPLGLWPSPRSAGADYGGDGGDAGRNYDGGHVGGRAGCVWLVSAGRYQWTLPCCCFRPGC